MTKETNRLRAQICEMNPFLEIVTYDRLFDDYSIGKDEVFDASKDEIRLIRELDEY